MTVFELMTVSCPVGLLTGRTRLYTICITFLIVEFTLDVCLCTKVIEMRAEYYPPREDVIVHNESPSEFYITVSGSVVSTLSWWFVVSFGGVDVVFVTLVDLSWNASELLNHS